MLVIMGDLLSISVGALFAAAVIPGVMLAGLYLSYICLTSFLDPSKAPALPSSAGPKNEKELIKLICKSFIPPVFLIFLVLGSIFGGWATPTEAAGVGCLGALILAKASGKLSMATLWSVIERAGLTNGMVFFIIFGATLFSYVFRSLGGDELIVGLLASLGIDTGWEILVFMLILTFALGFFFDWIEITLIVLPVFAPILQGIDFGPHLGDGGPILFLTWFVIMLSVNLQTSFLTPPFGFTLFYMKGTVPSSIEMGQIYRGIIPFVLLQLTGLLLLIFFPQLVLWLPKTVGFL